MTPKSNDTELKKIDFSQKPMGVPPIPFLGLEMVKKGVSIALHYVLSDVRGQVSGTDPYVNH